MKKIILKNEFFKNVTTLISGAVLAQIIPLIIAPIIAKIYSPKEFGLYAIFTSISGILILISNLKYDSSIVLAEDYDEMNKLISLAFIISNVFFVVSSLFILCFFNNKSFYVLILINTYLLSLKSILLNWSNREKLYKVYAKYNVINQLSITFFTLLVGFNNVFKFNGLILGTLIGNFISILYILFKFKQRKTFKFFFDKEVLIKIAIKYKQFPLYNILSSVTSTINYQIPIYLLRIFFGEEATGYYSFMTKYIMIPIGFISGAIGQVFYKKITSIREEFKCMNFEIRKLINIIGKIFIIPIIILLLFGRNIFLIIFGTSWEISGIIAQIMSISAMSILIIEPITYVFIVLKKQKTNLLINIVGVILNIVGLFIINIIFHNLYIFIFAYVLINTFIRIIIVKKVFKIIKESETIGGP